MLMQVGRKEINIRGHYVQVDSVRLDAREIVVSGKFLKTARLTEEMYDDVDNPEVLIDGLRRSGLDVDIFTFLERFPGPEPKYDYHLEWEAYTRMNIKTFDHWWNHQIRKTTRNRIRKSRKVGVVVRSAAFNDDLVEAISKIYNETSVRQGKEFWHYGKDLQAIRRDLSRDLDRSEFFGAYHNNQLIGFMKLLYTDDMADPVLFLSMMEHYDKSPNNALMAKAVEVCAERNIHYLDYGRWRSDNHAAFLMANGFEKMILPRYYCPLSRKGTIALKSHLHKGLLGVIPPRTADRLKGLRSRLISMKKVTGPPRSAAGGDWDN